jgi:hypothetical protein
MWRGKAGQKKAAEQEEKSMAGSERIVVAKRTIRNSQVAATFLVMLTTAMTAIGPTYICGAAYGAVANGEGIDGGIALNLGLRYAVFATCASYCQMEVFTWAMRDTAFVPGAAERVVRPLLAAVGGFLAFAGGWYFLDLQHPENDIGLVKGFPGVVVATVGCTLQLDIKAQPIELWRLYRARNLTLPPANASTWWHLTALAGRGTLAAALAVCGFNAAHISFEGSFLGISAAFDKAGTMETYIGEGKGAIDGWWYVHYFTTAIYYILSHYCFEKLPISLTFMATEIELCTLYEFYL